MFSLFIVSWTVVSLAYLSKIMCSKVPTSLVIYRFIQDDHSRKLIKHSLFFCFPVTWSNVIHALIFFHSRFSIHTWIGCWHCTPRMSSPAHLKTSRCYIKHNLILLCFPSLFMFQGKLVYHLVEKQWLKNIQRSLTVSLIQTCRVKTSYTVGLKMVRMLHQTHGPQWLLPEPCLSNQPAKPIPVCTSALQKHLTQVAWLPTLGPKYSWMFNVSNGWSNFAHLIYFFFIKQLVWVCLLIQDEYLINQILWWLSILSHLSQIPLRLSKCRTPWQYPRALMPGCRVSPLETRALLLQTGRDSVKTCDHVQGLLCWKRVRYWYKMFDAQTRGNTLALPITKWGQEKQK